MKEREQGGTAVSCGADEAAADLLAACQAVWIYAHRLPSFVAEKVRIALEKAARAGAGGGNETPT